MTDSTPPVSATPRPRRAAVALVLLGHVLVGLALGILLDRTVLHPRPFGGRFGRRPMAQDSAGQAAMRTRMRDEMLRGLSRELGLTAGQRDQVAQILGRHEAAFEALRRESEPRLRALVDSSWAEIDRVLTPEQHGRWVERRGLPFGRDRRPGPGRPGP
jgi:hypothetical protein